MKKVHVSALLFLLFPLLAIKCEPWTNLAREIRTTVRPDVIYLPGDTISFQVQLEPGSYKSKKDETIVFAFFALTGHGEELIFSTQDAFEKPLEMSIRAPLQTNDKVKKLGLKLQQYRGRKLKFESPILPVASVEDSR